MPSNPAKNPTRGRKLRSRSAFFSSLPADNWGNGLSPIDFGGLAALIAARGASRRTLTAIAGPPGSGKSHLAKQLADALNKLEPASAAVIEMDGFHLDDRVLTARGLLARKGGHETFDALGLAHLLARLRANEEAEIAVPVFDRSIEIARAGAQIISRETRHLIVEGNYLLLRLDPWARLAAHFTTTVMLQTDHATLHGRLVSRWAGLGMTAAAIKVKLEGNDLPNARLIIAESAAAEFSLVAD